MTNESEAQKLDSSIVSYDRLHEILHYNPETGIWTWLVTLNNKVKAGDIAGSVGEKGYNRIRFNGRAYLSSRLAWLYMTGEWPQGEIDHDDRNPLNDKWVNLKDSTSQQNQANRGPSITNLLGVKGVYKRGDKYVARYTRNYITTHLGTFDTIEEATKAYEEACRA